MKFIDRHRQVTSGTSAAVITLGAAELGTRTLAQAIAANEVAANDVSSFCMEDDAGNYEEFLATVNSDTQITRTATLRSSNNNAAVTFAGTKRVVYNTPTASFFSKLIGTDAAATTTVANTATSTLVLIEGGVAKTITLDNFLTAIGQNPASLPATSTFDDSDRLLVFKADGSAKTILGSIVKASGTGTPAPADTTAPTLSSPTGTQTGETTASGTVSTNEASGTLYRYVSANATETAATVKAANLTQAVTATGVQNVTFTGLTAATPYYAHYVHRDAAGNDSAVSSSAQFTTAAAGTMADTYVLKADGTKNSTFASNMNFADNASGDWYAEPAPWVNIRTADGTGTIDATQAKFVWGKLGEPCPIPSFASTGVTAPTNGLSTNRNNAVVSAAKLGSWSVVTDANHGTFQKAGTWYAWFGGLASGQTVTAVMWVVFSDNSSKRVDNGTGTPLTITLTVP